jgi:hypothetical protein
LVLRRSGVALCAASVMRYPSIVEDLSVQGDGAAGVSRCSWGEDNATLAGRPGVEGVGTQEMALVNVPGTDDMGAGVAFYTQEIRSVVRFGERYAPGGEGEQGYGGDRDVQPGAGSPRCSTTWPWLRSSLMCYPGTLPQVGRPMEHFRVGQSHGHWGTPAATGRLLASAHTCRPSPEVSSRPCRNLACRRGLGKRRAPGRRWIGTS